VRRPLKTNRRRAPGGPRSRLNVQSTAILGTGARSWDRAVRGVHPAAERRRCRRVAQDGVSAVAPVSDGVLLARAELKDDDGGSAGLDRVDLPHTSVLRHDGTDVGQLFGRVELKVTVGKPKLDNLGPHSAPRFSSLDPCPRSRCPKRRRMQAIAGPPLAATKVPRARPVCGVPSFRWPGLGAAMGVPAWLFRLSSTGVESLPRVTFSRARSPIPKGPGGRGGSPGPSPFTLDCQHWRKLGGRPTV